MRVWSKRLGMAYQRDTGRSAILEGMEVSARIGSWGDVIISGDELLESTLNKIVYRGTFDIPDMDYVEWLESKLIELGFKLD